MKEEQLHLSNAEANTYLVCDGHHLTVRHSLSCVGNISAALGQLLQFHLRVLKPELYRIRT